MGVFSGTSCGPAEGVVDDDRDSAVCAEEIDSGRAPALDTSGSNGGGVVLESGGGAGGRSAGLAGALGGVAGLADRTRTHVGAVLLMDRRDVDAAMLLAVSLNISGGTQTQ